MVYLRVHKFNNPHVGDATSSVFQSIVLITSWFDALFAFVTIDIALKLIDELSRLSLRSYM